MASVKSASDSKSNFESQLDIRSPSSLMNFFEEMKKLEKENHDLKEALRVEIQKGQSLEEQKQNTRENLQEKIMNIPSKAIEKMVSSSQLSLTNHHQFVEELVGWVIEFVNVEESWKKSKVENEFLKNEVKDLKEWNRKLKHRFEAFRREHTEGEEKLEQTVQPLEELDDLASSVEKAETPNRILSWADAGGDDADDETFGQSSTSPYHQFEGRRLEDNFEKSRMMDIVGKSQRNKRAQEKTQFWKNFARKKREACKQKQWKKRTPAATHSDEQSHYNEQQRQTDFWCPNQSTLAPTLSLELALFPQKETESIRFQFQ